MDFVVIVEVEGVDPHQTDPGLKKNVLRFSTMDSVVILQGVKKDLFRDLARQKSNASDWPSREGFRFSRRDSRDKA